MHNLSAFVVFSPGTPSVLLPPSRAETADEFIDDINREDSCEEESGISVLSEIDQTPSKKDASSRVGRSVETNNLSSNDTASPLSLAEKEGGGMNSPLVTANIKRTAQKESDKAGPSSTTTTTTTTSPIYEEKREQEVVVESPSLEHEDEDRDGSDKLPSFSTSDF
jgi:hypothetical protein